MSSKHALLPPARISRVFVPTPSTCPLQVVDYSVVRIAQGVTHFSPGSYDSMPTCATPIPNMFMSGDWIANDHGSFSQGEEAHGTVRLTIQRIEYALPLPNGQDVSLGCTVLYSSSVAFFSCREILLFVLSFGFWGRVMCHVIRRARVIEVHRCRRPGLEHRRICTQKKNIQVPRLSECRLGTAQRPSCTGCVSS